MTDIRDRIRAMPKGADGFWHVPSANGKDVIIYSVDGAMPAPIHGRSSDGCIRTWFENGKYDKDSFCGLDIIPPPLGGELWVNVYESNGKVEWFFHRTKQSADSTSAICDSYRNNRIARIRAPFKFTEGQFDE